MRCCQIAIRGCHLFSTISALLGSLCTGFILIPLIGIRPSLILTAGLNAVIGCVLIAAECRKITAFQRYCDWWHYPNRWCRVDGIAVGEFARLFLKNGTFWAQRVQTIRWSSIPKLSTRISKRYGKTQRLWIAQGIHRIYVDNDEIADTSRRGSTPHRIIAHLPLLLHPNPRTRTYSRIWGRNHVPHHDAARVCVWTPSKIRRDSLNRHRKYFADVNHNVLDSALFSYTADDERNYLLMMPKRYDVISIGARHPLVSSRGSNLYTADFYRWCKRILTEDGIICQWIPLKRLPETHLKIIVRTFIEVFPNATIWHKIYAGLCPPDWYARAAQDKLSAVLWREHKFRVFTRHSRLDDLDGMSLLDSFMMGEKAAPGVRR